MYSSQELDDGASSLQSDIGGAILTAPQVRFGSKRSIYLLFLLTFANSQSILAKSTNPHRTRLGNLKTCTFAKLAAKIPSN